MEDYDTFASAAVGDRDHWKTLLCSICFFALTRSALRRRVVRQGHLIQQQQDLLNWKVVNTANSLIHSVVTGTGALFCFYDDPRHADDVVNSVSAVSIHLTAFSVGYFVFDVFDMVMNQLRRRSTHELLLHHGFVLLCFGTSLLSSRYLGFVMVALVIELNSVFLHWRQLLLLLSSSSSTGRHQRSSSSSSLHFRLVSVLNLVTFVVFRIVTMGWMTRWLVLNKEQVTSPPVYLLGCVAMTTIVAMSAVLLSRLVKADLPLFTNCSRSNKKDIIDDGRGQIKQCSS